MTLHQAQFLIERWRSRTIRSTRGSQRGFVSIELERPKKGKEREDGFKNSVFYQKMVSGLGLEPRALTLKAQPNLKKINHLMT